jgi:Mg2+ and Co2+ transporter CorA
MSSGRWLLRFSAAPNMVYGHLRDFRDEPDAVTLQAGSLCVVASRTLLVTGLRIPLRSVKEMRRRVEARTILPESPFGLITEFFRALNDIGEGLLQEATERLSVVESKVLKRSIAGSREEILEMRRESIRIARDMAYKRTAMLELACEHPMLLSLPTNLTASTARSIAMRHWSKMRKSTSTVSSCLKSCGRRLKRKPTGTFTYSRCSR